MTSAEMLILLRERYNLSSNSNAGKQDDELYLLLNTAIDIFVNRVFSGNNENSISFEQDNKRKNDLRTLIKNSQDLTPGNDFEPMSNGKSFSLPNDYRFIIKVFAKLGNDWYPCDTIENEEINKFIKTPLNKPIIDTPKVIMNDNGGITLLFDSDLSLNSTKCRIKYLKNPVKIASGVNCDLPEHTHVAIVELANMIIIEGIENINRFQTSNEIFKRAE